ncbi:cupin domain-containing protein [Arundinibacter roseus]|uniref:Cupin domain-containing protein n=1 Tax=Arundinibacter roseus TaxID=2070510 RepID=A0A4R4KPX1_9BACT|nr:cupin domain-containing protein [Arundinibacter roseus]TDB68942.1 cupin domain-containing protein [Arundinibacter roseus]
MAEKKKSAAYWVEKLTMQAHPEGGYFAETYRAAELISAQALPSRFGGARSFGTAIYFLLEGHHVSALHRIQADELWHFYTGDPLEVFVIDPETGELSIIRLGNDPEAGQVFQAVVPAGMWFGSKPMAGGSYSLVGCTVAPGFDFEDFELADRSDLLGRYPQHSALIEQLT